MKVNRSIVPFLQRKLATLILLTVSIAAFAALGEGGKKEDNPRNTKNLLSARSASVNYKNFSLRSGYNYRGNKIFSEAPAGNYIILNKVITVEKGNQAYILPMKRKVLLEHVTFKPSASRY